MTEFYSPSDDPLWSARFAPFREGGARRTSLETWLGSSSAAQEWLRTLKFARFIVTQHASLTKQDQKIIKMCLGIDGDDIRKTLSSQNFDIEIQRELFGDPEEYAVKACPVDWLPHLLSQPSDLIVMVGMCLTCMYSVHVHFQLLWPL